MMSVKLILLFAVTLLFVSCGQDIRKGRNEETTTQRSTSSNSPVVTTSSNNNVNMDVTCNYNGVYYYGGSSFPSIDGCNSCSCLSTGQVGCTMMACN